MPDLPAAVWILIVVAIAAILGFALFKGTGMSLRLGKLFSADVAKSNNRNVTVASDLDATGTRIGNVTGVRGDTGGVRSVEVARHAHLKNSVVGDITGEDTTGNRDGN